MCLGIFFFNTCAILSQANTPVAGKHYQPIAPGSTESNQITLYCWLGSPSCYQVEFALSEWVQETNLVLVNQPVIKRPHWRRLAKARLVARQMAMENEFVSRVYQALHLDKQDIADDDTLITLAEEIGLSKSRFTNLFYAAETNQALNDIQQEASYLPIKGVPTVILKQRWLVDASMHKNSRSLINTLNYLVSQEG
jgi:thiol:disulfide interchange protein DsbA